MKKKKIETRDSNNNNHNNHHHLNNNNKPQQKIKNKPLFKLSLSRNHLQIVTNRKRSLFVEWIDQDLAILTIETSIIFTTFGHMSNGRLQSRNTINNHSKNLGLISRYNCTDLVKLIQVADIPMILNEFQSGKSLLQIKYSSWPLTSSYSNHHHHPIIDAFNCDRFLSRLFNAHNSIYMSAYKTSSFTCRIIKSISEMIGF